MSYAGTRLLVWLNRLENGLIAILALMLVLLSGAQVLLRLGNQGIVWLDPLLRVLVLWLAMLGALAAARGDKHISLDVLGRVLHGPARRVARLFAFGFAAVVSAMLAEASLGLIEVDREAGTLLFNTVPGWWAEIILPLAFGLLALRFALRAVLTGEEPTP
ncbi:MAG: TRAP transporter small permease [Lysobacterales bacterium]